jgi:hypothetical protein
VAMAVLMNQAMAKTAAKAKAEPVPALAGSLCCGGPPAATLALGWVAGLAGWVCRGNAAFSGNPSSRWAAAQPAQAPRQPHRASIQADRGQPTVLANPATSVMPVMAPRELLP